MEPGRARWTRFLLSIGYIRWKWTKCGQGWKKPKTSPWRRNDHQESRLVCHLVRKAPRVKKTSAQCGPRGDWRGSSLPERKACGRLTGIQRLAPKAYLDIRRRWKDGFGGVHFLKKVTIWRFTIKVMLLSSMAKLCRTVKSERLRVQVAMVFISRPYLVWFIYPAGLAAEAGPRFSSAKDRRLRAESKKEGVWWQESDKS